MKTLDLNGRTLCQFTRSLVFLMMAAAVSCRAPEPPAALERIRVGVLPDREPELLREQHEPLLAHLAASTGIEMELAIPPDYAELLKWFDENQIQLAWFGGMTFLEAESKSDARPLVSRDIDLSFTTDFLMAASRSEQSLGDFAGATFSFGPALSTSGHLMAREHLRLQGLDAESFFGEVRYSNGHDETVRWVKGGEVDLGAVNSRVVDLLFRNGHLSADDVRVLQTKAPYQNYVWAVRPEIESSTLIALRDAFLDLDASVPRHASILSQQSAGGYVPVVRDSYFQLRLAVERLPADDEGS